MKPRGRRADSRIVPRRTVATRQPVAELRRAWRENEGRSCVVLEASGYRKWCWVYRGRTYHVHVQEAGVRFEVMRA